MPAAASSSEQFLQAFQQATRAPVARAMRCAEEEQHVELTCMHVSHMTVADQRTCLRVRQL